MYDSSETVIIRRLIAVAGQLRRRLLCRSLAAGGFGAVAICAVATVLEWLFGLGEPAAGGVLLLAFLVGGGLSLWYFRRHARSWPQLALDLEERHPELQDALICATELEELRRPLRPIEAELLEAMRQKVEHSHFLTEAFRARLGWRAPLLHLILALVLAITLTWSLAVRKGVWAWHDLLAGHSSGIRILLVEREFPVRSDIRLAVQVTRWEPEAVVEMRQKSLSGLKKSVFPLLPQDDGTLAFTLFEVEQPFTFRIVTPSLRSRWEAVSLYVPPVSGPVRLWTEPLAYTGRQPETWPEIS